jgi:hypothetical protein
MKYQIYEKEHHTISDLLKGMVPTEGNILEDKYAGIAYTNSARAALRIILDYLKLQGQISNKNAEVLVPQWMCMSVSMSMHKICFPSLSVSNKTRGLMVYHQYGFPQNMDEIMPIAEQNNWFVIENCVNVFDSSYKGRRLGTFGLAGIFSFAKMFPLPIGGALVTENSDILRYANESICHGHNSFISNVWLLSRIINEFGDNHFGQKMQVMAESLISTTQSIPSISLNIARKEIRDGAMKDRQENYHFLLDYFKDYDFFQNLERNIIPYVVPLIADEHVLQKIKAKFLASGIWTDIYHFDINRNILNPNFKKCVWVPIHHGVSREKMDMICKLIRYI